MKKRKLTRLDIVLFILLVMGPFFGYYTRVSSDGIISKRFFFWGLVRSQIISISAEDVSKIVITSDFFKAGTKYCVAILDKKGRQTELPIFPNSNKENTFRKRGKIIEGLKGKIHSFYYIPFSGMSFFPALLLVLRLFGMEWGHPPPEPPAAGFDYWNFGKKGGHH